MVQARKPVAVESDESDGCFNDVSCCCYGVVWCASLCLLVCLLACLFFLVSSFIARFIVVKCCMWLVVVNLILLVLFLLIRVLCECRMAVGTCRDFYTDVSKKHFLGTFGHPKTRI